MKLFNKIAYILMILIIASCNEDDGNYSYTSLPEADFSAMADQVDALLGERLLVKGDVDIDLNEESIAFAWYTTKFIEGVNYADTLSTERDLDIFLTIPPGNEIPVYYSVYDKEHEVRYVKKILINVQTPFSEGWGILKEKNGKAEYDFISYVTSDYYVDILENISKVNLEGKPLELFYNYKKGSGIYSWSTTSILTEQGGVFLDSYSMEKESSMLDRWRSTSSMELPFTGAYLSNDAYGNAFASFFVGGKLYPKLASIPTDLWWEIPVAGDYHVSKYAVVLSRDWIILFDDVERKYIYALGGLDADLNGMHTLSAANDDPAFDPNTVNKDLLWMEGKWSDARWSYNKPIVSVLKDDAGVYYMHRFSGSDYSGFNAELEFEFPSGSVNDMSCFASNPTSLPYTYIATGNKIHRYNHESDGLTLDFLTLEGNITKLAVDHEGEVMAVVLENGTASVVVLLDLLNDGQELSRYNVDSGVVDIKYRNDSDMQYI